MKDLAGLATIIVAAFLIVAAVLLPASVIVGRLRRWFWFGLVARGWARVEQAKNRQLQVAESGNRARDAYLALRDALMEDASKAGHGDWTYKRREVLTRIAQAAAALEDEIPELKPQIDEILCHAKENSFYGVDHVRQWLAPISERVNRDVRHSPKKKR